MSSSADPPLGRGRRIAIVVLAVVAVLLAGLAASLVYGLTAEYGGLGGGRLGTLPVIGFPAVPALIAVALAGTRRALVLGAVFVALTGAVVVGAGEWGHSANQERREASSESLSCDGFVDDRIDEAVRDLPRPVLLYGPVSASATSCQVAVDEPDVEKAVQAMRGALADDGWTLRTSGSGFFGERDDLRVRGTIDGAPDQQLLIEVTVAP